MMQARGDKDSRKVRLSKNMSRILRHKAQEFGIPIRPDGFVKVVDLMRHQSMRGHEVEDVIGVVESCEKQRFQLREEDGELLVRAQQGHTIAKVEDEALLVRIAEDDPLTFCYHGTYTSNLVSIRANGLNRMQRNHVHCTPALPGEREVISGMRRSVDAIVVVDMKAAMAAGIPFFRSGNNVILTPGLGHSGAIPPQFLVDYISPNAHSPWKRPRDAVASADAPGSKECVALVPKLPHYYCVIDFEATCERDSKIPNQEIIEFPAVLVNAETLAPEFEFHSYVKPVRNPVLSSFCTELTGIDQTTVDSAPTFSDVYASFKVFMRDHGFDIDHNWEGLKESTAELAASITSAPPLPYRTVQFVSYGDFEFRTIFPAQCQLVGDTPPLQTREWINVKVLFQRRYRKAKQRGMAGAMEYLSLPLVGRHHSGLDDTRNIATILKELHQRGVKIHPTGHW